MDSQISNVKIESDGTYKGTQITVDGTPIRGVYSLSFSVDRFDHLATATIEVLAPAIDFEGMAITEQDEVEPTVVETTDMSGNVEKIPGMTMRVLVSGSRDWRNQDKISMAFGFYIAPHFGKEITIVHGGSPTGVDPVADRVARQLGFNVEVRTENLVDPSIDLALVFIRDESDDAILVQRLAREAGIITHSYRESSLWEQYEERTHQR